MAFFRSRSPESIVRISPFWMSRAVRLEPARELVGDVFSLPGPVDEHAEIVRLLPQRFGERLVVLKPAAPLQSFLGGGLIFPEIGRGDARLRARSALCRGGLRQSPLRKSAARAEGPRGRGPARRSHSAILLIRSCPRTDVVARFASTKHARLVAGSLATASVAVRRERPARPPAHRPSDDVADSCRSSAFAAAGRRR